MIFIVFLILSFHTFTKSEIQLFASTDGDGDCQKDNPCMFNCSLILYGQGGEDTTIFLKQGQYDVGIFLDHGVPLTKNLLLTPYEGENSGKVSFTYAGNSTNEPLFKFKDDTKVELTLSNISIELMHRSLFGFNTPKKEQNLESSVTIQPSSLRFINCVVSQNRIRQFFSVKYTKYSHLSYLEFRNTRFDLRSFLPQFYNKESITINITDSHFSDSDQGMVILSDGNVIFHMKRSEMVRVSGNGVYFDVSGDVNLFLEDSIWSGNSANFIGGALFMNAADVTFNMHNCTVSNCKAPGKGGGVDINGETVEFNVYDSEFIGNLALENIGGAVNVNSHDFIGDIQNTNFSDNSADTGGGAISLSSVSVNLKSYNVQFVNNHVEHTSGGGLLVYAMDVTLDFDRCRFDSNRVSLEGAGFYVRGGGLGTLNLTVSSCDFRNNSAARRTGFSIQLLMSDSAVDTSNEVTVRDSRFIDNKGDFSSFAIIIDVQNPESHQESCLSTTSNARQCVDLHQQQKGSGVGLNGMVSVIRNVFSGGYETNGFVYVKAVSNRTIIQDNVFTKTEEPKKNEPVLKVLLLGIAAEFQKTVFDLKNTSFDFIDIMAGNGNGAKISSFPQISLEFVGRTVSMLEKNRFQNCQLIIRSDSSENNGDMWNEVFVKTSTFSASNIIFKSKDFALFQFYLYDSYLLDQSCLTIEENFLWLDIQRTTFLQSRGLIVRKFRFISVQISDTFFIDGNKTSMNFDDPTNMTKWSTKSCGGAVYIEYPNEFQSGYEQNYTGSVTLSNVVASGNHAEKGGFLCVVGNNSHISSDSDHQPYSLHVDKFCNVSSSSARFGNSFFFFTENLDKSHFSIEAQVPKSSLSPNYGPQVYYVNEYENKLKKSDFSKIVSEDFSESGISFESSPTSFELLHKKNKVKCVFHSKSYRKFWCPVDILVRDSDDNVKKSIPSDISDSFVVNNFAEGNVTGIREARHDEKPRGCDCIRVFIIVEFDKGSNIVKKTSVTLQMIGFTGEIVDTAVVNLLFALCYWKKDEDTCNNNIIALVVVMTFVGILLFLAFMFPFCCFICTSAEFLIEYDSTVYNPDIKKGRSGKYSWWKRFTLWSLKLMLKPCFLWHDSKLKKKLNDLAEKLRKDKQEEDELHLKYGGKTIEDQTTENDGDNDGYQRVFSAEKAPVKKKGGKNTSIMESLVFDNVEELPKDGNLQFDTFM